MKILWLSHLVPYPPKGGVLQRSYHLLRQTALQHSVHLLAFVQRDLWRTHYPDTASAEADCRESLSFCDSLSFIEIPVDHSVTGKPGLALKVLCSRYPYTVNWLICKQFRLAIDAALRRERFDLIHFDTISLAYYLERAAGIPATLDHHNVESQMMLRRAEVEPNLPKKLYFFQEGLRLRRFERAVCNRFASNLMCSELDAQRLHEICPDVTTDVIPNGVDLDYFSPEVEADRGASRQCLFVGRLSAYTNRQSAIFIVQELWPKLSAAVPDVRFAMVGSNPPLEALALADTDPRFTVTGFVDDVRPYMDSAAVYVCPMFDGGGTKLKILDAMAMKKAIVASPLAVEGINVVEGSDLLVAETADDFVSAIAALLDDPVKASRLGGAARARVAELYSYASIGPRLSRVFERARANRAPRPAEY